MCTTITYVYVAINRSKAFLQAGYTFVRSRQVLIN
jgi:hypothetical protein